MFNFRIRVTRVAPHFGSGVGYGPSGAVGDKRVESSGFRSKRRKAEVSTPILFNPAADAAVSLLGGAADIEETFDPVRSLDGRLRTSVSAADRFGCTSGAS